MSAPTASRLRAWWRRQQFEPGWAGLAVNPFFFARRGLLAELRPLFPELTGEVLDVGCGRKPYRAHVAATRYVGVDVETEATRGHGDVDVFYDGRTLPFATASFDGVLCSQVLEHVFTPEDFLREIARVLRPGGRLVYSVCTPVPEEGREIIEAVLAAGGWKRVAIQRGEISGFQDSLTGDGDVLTLPHARVSRDAPGEENAYASMNSDAFYVARLERL